MRNEPLALINESDTLVRPIRRKDAPHFRRLSESIFVDRIGRSESDPTHEECIKFLVRKLQNNRLRITTPTFDEKGKRERDGQTLHEAVSSSTYLWWHKAADCRIPAGKRRYIQPDICGRDPSAFWPGAKNKNVIIEVIQTHAPEEDTFFQLLELSAVNYLVLFYFIAPEVFKTQYSQYYENGSELIIRTTHYLMDGEPYKNGEVTGPKKSAGQTDREWLSHIYANYFGTPMREKKADRPKAVET